MKTRNSSLFFQLLFAIILFCVGMLFGKAGKHYYNSIMSIHEQLPYEDSLEIKTLQYGDTIAYNNLKKLKMSKDLLQECWFYSIIMAKQYHYLPAYEDVYDILHVLYDSHKSLGEVDSVSENVIIQFLIEGEKIKETDPKPKILYKRWCELSDSMIAYGKKLMPNQHSPLLEKGCKLNKEQKVFCTLSPLYNVGDTVYILEEINSYTSTVLFAFWNKKSGNVYGTDRVYEYRYMRYQKKGILNEGKKEICDSVFIKNDPDICSFSDKLIKTCSEWDTLQLKRNKNLDGVSSDHRYMLAYRIIILTDNQFDLKCVKIASQDNIGDETTEPYMVIPVD
jgi:hypothetical protein